MSFLKGKVAVISGGSRGIGRGIVKSFVEHGADVAFTYSSSSDAAIQLENELSSNISKVKSYQSNAADFKAAENLTSSVIEDFGKIDIFWELLERKPKKINAVIRIIFSKVEIS